MRVFFVALVVFVSSFCWGDDSASLVFDKLKPLVFQVRVINVASGDKSSIGSGFQLDRAGFVATNFHVVSSFVHHPDKFRLVLVAHDGQFLPAELVDIDVVHDVAVLKVSPVVLDGLEFAGFPLSQGERIFSVGNPVDLGMTVIEGIFNGLIKESRYQKFLFSGSLNPGMSGGPAVNRSGEVVGLNVAKGGEQISFLVPVRHLVALYSRAKAQKVKPVFADVVSDALYDDQDFFYQGLLSSVWPVEPFVQLSLPGRIAPFLKCWDNSFDDDERRYDLVSQWCGTQDRIYVDDDFYTGSLRYQYIWLSSDELNQFQFFSLLEQVFKHRVFENVGGKDVASNFECDDKFVVIDGRHFRSSFCVRQYKKVRDLFDVSLVLASVDRPTESVVIKLNALGISRQRSQQFLKKFLGDVAWQF